MVPVAERPKHINAQVIFRSLREMSTVNQHRQISLSPQTDEPNTSHPSEEQTFLHVFTRLSDPSLLFLNMLQRVLMF